MRLCQETRLTLMQPCAEAVHKLSEDDRSGIAQIAPARQEPVELRVLFQISRIRSELHRVVSKDLREPPGDIAVPRRPHHNCRQRLQVGYRLRLHRSYELSVGIQRIE